MSKTLADKKREQKKQQKLKRLAKKETKKTRVEKVADDFKESLVDRTSRPLTESEFDEILKCALEGFTYTDENGKVRKFRKNKQLALTLMIASNIGLRLADVSYLKVGDINNGHLKVQEQKTGKIQDREISGEMYQLLMNYALDNGLRRDDFFISVGERALQKQLKIIRDYLNLEKVSSHSFRKTYATNQYIASGNNIRLVQALLNHSSVETTEKYIGIKQEEIDKASSSYVAGSKLFAQF